MLMVHNALRAIMMYDRLSLTDPRRLIFGNLRMLQVRLGVLGQLLNAPMHGSVTFSLRNFEDIASHTKNALDIRPYANNYPSGVVWSLHRISQLFFLGEVQKCEKWRSNEGLHMHIHTHNHTYIHSYTRTLVHSYTHTGT